MQAAFGVCILIVWLVLCFKFGMPDLQQPVVARPWDVLQHQQQQQQNKPLHHNYVECIGRRNGPLLYQQKYGFKSDSWPKIMKAS